MNAEWKQLISFYKTEKNTLQNFPHKAINQNILWYRETLQYNSHQFYCVKISWLINNGQAKF